MRRRQSTGSRKSETGRAIRAGYHSHTSPTRAGAHVSLSHRKPTASWAMVPVSVRSSRGPVNRCAARRWPYATAIVMSREAVYLAFMKSMRDPLSESRIADIIDQARGKAPADLVIKAVGIFDLTSGEIAVGDIAIARRPHRRHLRDLCRRHRDRRARAHRRAGLHRQPRPLRIDPGPPLEFDRCVVPRGTTTAICDPHEICNVLGAAGCNTSSKCAAVTVMDLRVQLSSCVPATPSRNLGRAAGGGGPAALRDHPKVLGLAEFMNVPGVLNKDPGVLRQAGGLLGRADRRPFAAAVVLRPQRLYRRRRAQLPRDDVGRRGAREARKGMQILIREGTVSKDLAALAELITTERAPFLALLHRRPQPARHRRGRPHRLPDPRRHRPGRAAARRLSRRHLVGGARISACSTAGWWRRASAPTSCCWRISRPARSIP